MLNERQKILKEDIINSLKTVALQRPCADDGLDFLGKIYDVPKVNSDVNLDIANPEDAEEINFIRTGLEVLNRFNCFADAPLYRDDADNEFASVYDALRLLTGNENYTKENLRKVQELIDSCVTLRNDKRNEFALAICDMYLSAESAPVAEDVVSKMNMIRKGIPVKLGYVAKNIGVFNYSLINTRFMRSVFEKYHELGKEAVEVFDSAMELRKYCMKKNINVNGLNDYGFVSKLDLLRQENNIEADEKINRAAVQAEAFSGNWSPDPENNSLHLETDFPDLETSATVQVPTPDKTKDIIDPHGYSTRTR